VRFSDAEWVLVRDCAALAGAAVGAWLGELAVTAADPSVGAIGLQDLLRLHADVVVLEQAAMHANGGLERGDQLDLLSAHLAPARLRASVWRSCCSRSATIARCGKARVRREDRVLVSPPARTDRNTRMCGRTGTSAPVC
jgi:hypothetical protein